MDQSGRALAVWQYGAGVGWSRYLPASGWSSESSLSVPAGGLQGLPALAVSADGDAVLGWQEADGAAGTSVFARRFAVDMGATHDGAAHDPERRCRQRSRAGRPPGSYSDGGSGMSMTLKHWLAAFLAAVLATLTPPALADETITCIHWDALGSPVAATDEAGNVVWRESYRPYGERIDNEAAASPNSRWYTGHPQDADTGLVYAGARYYDPVVGRFLAIDPVGVQEDNLHSFNRYAYANNNPYKYVDPTGEFGIVAGIAIGVGLELLNLGSEIYDTTNNPCSDCVRSSGAGIPSGVGAGVAKLPGKLTRTSGKGVAKGTPKSLKDQAADLVPQNANKNRVTLRSPNQKMEVDLTGRIHGDVPTPHTKVSPRNLNAPKQPAYNTKNSPVRPATQQNIRTVRRYLERQRQQ